MPQRRYKQPLRDRLSVAAIPRRSRSWVVRYAFEGNSTVVKNPESSSPAWGETALGTSKVSALSLEISLNKFGTGVDADLPQRRLAKIDEAMRRICRNNNNAARFYFAPLIADRDLCGTLNREGDFNVRMRV